MSMSAARAIAFERCRRKLRCSLLHRTLNYCKGPKIYRAHVWWADQSKIKEKTLRVWGLYCSKTNWTGIENQGRIKISKIFQFFLAVILMCFMLQNNQESLKKNSLEKRNNIKFSTKFLNWRKHLGFSTPFFYRLKGRRKGGRGRKKRR